MKTYTITLELDEDDYRDWIDESATYDESMLPDGDSNREGAIVGEIIRSLQEYRSLWEKDNPIDKGNK